MSHLLTTRLRMEALKAQHAELLHEPLQADDIYTYIPDTPPALHQLERRYAFLENGLSPDGKERWLNWVAFLRDTVTPIGTFQATLPTDAHADGYLRTSSFQPSGNKGLGPKWSAPC